MARVTGTVVGKDAVLAKYRARRYAIVDRLYRSMLEQMARLAEYVRARKLSGQVLRTRTGTLRRSIHPGAKVEGNTISGTIGTNVEYAHVHENGGLFRIPAHSRTLTMVFGQPVAPRPIAVRAHNAVFPQRAFLRPSLEERRSSIVAALRKTVMDTMHAP